MTKEITDLQTKRFNMTNIKDHWNKVYSKNEITKLGWYEENPQPSLDLIRDCKLNKDATILDVGSGVSTLIINLILDSYSNIIATDISEVALDRAAKLLEVGEAAKIKWVVDDITNPKTLLNLQSVDLWHDRTVLHFLIDKTQQKKYLRTLKALVPIGSFVILAVFSLDGAKKCSGLDVKNYDHKMISEFLGNNYKLLKYFPYLYKMPSGDLRPYIYTLFKRIDKT